MTAARVVRIDAAAGADRDLLGGKAAGLASIVRLGLPTPPAFVLTTEAFRAYRRQRGVPATLWSEVADELAWLEAATGRRFGGTPPLLVSVRSGAPVSMPGMMDTLLNVGRSPAGLADELLDAFVAVFDSWDGRRARSYRQARGIADDLGTAVTVQAMVLGDLDDRSGTGVYHSRHPMTGADEPYGEWLPRAQGEALVSGERDPEPLASLAAALPGPYGELVDAGRRLAAALGVPVEIEYTVEAGRLWLLQVRPSRSEQADGHIGGQVPTGPAAGDVLARGTAASPGRATGLVVDDPDEVADLAGSGRPLVLARVTTSPHDIHGFLAAVAVVTERGGATSHAAVVGRQLGLPCVVGCGSGTVSALVGRVVTVDGTTGQVHAGPVEVAGV